MMAQKKVKLKQQRLPGTEDSRIQELEDLAEKYVDARDQRLEMLKDEVGLKEQILAKMHGLKKVRYEYNGTIIEIVPEAEKLKVKIKKDED
jgi:hypothetical protein